MATYLEWDANEGWSVTSAYEGTSGSLSSQCRTAKGIEINGELWSHGINFSSAISIFHPQGDLTQPLVLHVSFGTIVDRNLFPIAGEKPRLKILKALQNIALTMANSIECDGFALGTTDDENESLRPLNLSAVVGDFLDPSNPDIDWGDDLFYCGIKKDKISKRQIVDAGWPSKNLEDSPSGYVIWDMYAE